MRTTSTFGRILGELEHQVMRVLWAKRHGATVREVLESLPAGGKDAAYTTVLTILNRLVAKGLLARAEHKQPHVYQTNYSQREFYNSIADKLLNKIRSECGHVAVACFVEEAEKMSRKKFKKLLRRLEKPA